MKDDDLERACTVYWGEWIDYQNCSIPISETPETLLISKDTINSLPQECKILAEIIINLPEEMFLFNGKLKQTLFQKFVKLKTGWTKEKVTYIQYKLAQSLVR